MQEWWLGGGGGRRYSQLNVKSDPDYTLRQASIPRVLLTNEHGAAVTAAAGAAWASVSVVAIAATELLSFCSFLSGWLVDKLSCCRCYNVLISCCLW